MYKINTHSISDVRNKVNNSDWMVGTIQPKWVVMVNYMCMYVCISNFKFIHNHTLSSGQFTQAIVTLYWVYYKTIIQQCMLIVDNSHVKIRYTFFSYVFKSCLSFVSCKIVWMQKNLFGVRNTQYKIALNFHTQSNVFNATYMIQSRMNWPTMLIM